MGDILELIKTRRNIKFFLPKYVSWDNIARVIDAGRHAPSCGNIQNWKFVVVTEAAGKQKLAELAYEQYDIAAAGALIVVCAEVDKAERYYGLRGERLYSLQNCAAAIQNMLLEAHSLGLGSSWVGAFDEDNLKLELSIPEEVRPQAIIAIGYAKQVPEKPPKYPLESLVYLARWRNRIRDLAKYTDDIAVILGRKAEAAKQVWEIGKEKLQESSSSVVDKAKEKVSGFLKKKQ